MICYRIALTSISCCKAYLRPSIFTAATLICDISPHSSGKARGKPWRHRRARQRMCLSFLPLGALLTAGTFFREEYLRRRPWPALLSHPLLLLSLCNGVMRSILVSSPSRSVAMAAPAESATAIQHRILSMAQSAPKGITDKDIQAEIPDLQPMQRAKAINSLLAQGLLDLFHQGGILIYKVKAPSQSHKVEGGDNEEKVVYGIIEEAGNKGIWIRDIRNRSNLIPTQLNKIIKVLEGKKLIKAVKSIAASKKKVYMLYNLEADPSVTGGAWYCDHDFEAEFVDVLNQQCYRYLEQKLEATKDCKGGPIASRSMSFASCLDVWKFISDLGISKVQLSPEDMETILDTLVYDGKVERSLSSDGSRLYRAVNCLLPTPGFVQIPCGVCPVLRLCSDIGSVNPRKCVYMKEWLE